jgi:hypothetical protein
MCETYDGCRCQMAVTNAYRQLRERGVSDFNAFDTAAVIYRYHHPDTTVTQARSQIAEWLDRG